MNIFIQKNLTSLTPPPNNIHQMERATPTTTTTVTIVTLAATYVCTTQFHIISRHANNAVTQNENYRVQWVEAQMESGSNKPDQLVI